MGVNQTKEIKSSLSSIQNCGIRLLKQKEEEEKAYRNQLYHNIKLLKYNQNQCEEIVKKIMKLELEIELVRLLDLRLSLSITNYNEEGIRSNHIKSTMFILAYLKYYNKLNSDIIDEYNNFSNIVKLNEGEQFWKDYSYLCKDKVASKLVVKYQKYIESINESEISQMINDFKSKNGISDVEDIDDLYHNSEYFYDEQSLLDKTVDFNFNSYEYNLNINDEKMAEEKWKYKKGSISKFNIDNLDKKENDNGNDENKNYNHLRHHRQSSDYSNSIIKFDDIYTYINKIEESKLVEKNKYIFQKQNTQKAFLYKKDSQSKGKKKTIDAISTNVSSINSKVRSTSITYSPIMNMNSNKGSFIVSNGNTIDNKYNIKKYYLDYKVFMDSIINKKKQIYKVNYEDFSFEMVNGLLKIKNKLGSYHIKILKLKEKLLTSDNITVIDIYNNTLIIKNPFLVKEVDVIYDNFEKIVNSLKEDIHKTKKDNLEFDETLYNLTKTHNIRPSDKSYSTILFKNIDSSYSIRIFCMNQVFSKEWNLILLLLNKSFVDCFFSSLNKKIYCNIIKNNKNDQAELFVICLLKNSKDEKDVKI